MQIAEQNANCRAKMQIAEQNANCRAKMLAQLNSNLVLTKGFHGGRLNAGILLETNL